MHNLNQSLIKIHAIETLTVLVINGYILEDLIIILNEIKDAAQIGLTIVLNETRAIRTYRGKFSFLYLHINLLLQAL